MEPISPHVLLSIVLCVATGLCCFHVGRLYERCLWAPGEGLHLIGGVGSGQHWVVRHSDERPSLSERTVKGWTELSPEQRAAALNRPGPPQTMHQARDFLFEIDSEDGTISGKVGPVEENGEAESRYTLSFERRGGYQP